MARWLFAPMLLILLIAGRLSAQAGDPDLIKALALEKSLQKIIKQNEVSIACILVSRSERYQEVGQGPDKSSPGRLGVFHPAMLKGVSEEQRKQYLKDLDFTHPGYVPRAFGSGVVIDPRGMILTNYHVVQDATKIFVRLPGGLSSYADIHAADPRSDLAVLKLLNPDVRPLRAVTLGNADRMERGQFVLTLANPFAVGFRDGQPSASWGILSNVRRRAMNHLKEEERIKPLQYYATLLQTDARLHLGCSGGALFNLSGEMVGLITSVAAIQGGETPGGFAVPVNAGMRRIIDVLVQGEEVDYGFLGVAFDERNGNAEARLGVVLKYITPGSPAKLEAKLEDNDVLLGVNGQAVHDIDDVFATVGANLTGTKVRLHIRRKGVERFADVTLAKLSVPGKSIASSTGSRPFFRGLRVDHASLVVQPPLRQSATIPPGVLISEVQSASPADRANLKSGDVITHVNQIPVLTPAAFYKGVAGEQGPLELTVQGVPNRVLLK